MFTNPNEIARPLLRPLSMGSKFLLVCAMALLMSIGALFLDSMVDERAGRQRDVAQEVSAHAGGAQTFLGPTLLVPYTIAVNDKPDTHGVYVLFPENAKAQIKTSVEDRRRSLFRIPVFQADAQMNATFNIGQTTSLPAGAQLDWQHAEMVIGVSDARGALADATLTTPNGVVTLTPAATVNSMTYSKGDNKPSLTLFGAPMHGLAQPGSRFAVTAGMKFSGAQRMTVLAYGQSTELAVRSNWPSPGFDGSFVPVSRAIHANGFEAAWSVPSIARGVRAEGDALQITGLDTSAMGVNFVQVADPYQSMTRSVKYAPLFLWLVFLTYFIFEATTSVRVHVAQYLLVGLAQLIFYLLLLSISERAGFDTAFALAGAATVLLLSTNAGWVFRARTQGLRACAVFAALYALIYALLRLEDNALLIGALGSFAAVSAAMFFTRSINWFGGSHGPAAPPSTVSSGAMNFRVGEL